MSAILERDDRGEPVRSFTVVNDVRVRRRIERELIAASRDQRRLRSELIDVDGLLDSVLDAIPDPVFVKDRALLRV
jgi:PAS domain-containing protein